TTGLDPEKCEIIEAAAVRTVVQQDTIRIVEQVQHKIYPEYPVDPFIARINGFNEIEWSEDFTDFNIAIGEVFDLMRGAWHAGSNPKFDESFLQKAAEEL